MLRGDDDLLSLMEEMGNVGGAEKSGEQRGRKKKKRTRDDDASRPTTASNGVRLLAEVEGYGHTTNATAASASASDEIWNPYVHVALSPRASGSLDVIVPTNPHVEILRRRAYEKFKRGFYAIFQSTAESARAAEGDAKLHEMKRADRAGTGGSTPSGNGNIDNQRRKEDRTILNQTWGELPSHSILERWHFAAKVEEDMLARECRSSSSEKIEQEASPPLCAGISGDKSTAIIRDAIVMNRRNGTSVDPILINLPQKTQQRQDSPTTNLLKEEIVFQWKRERRRKVGIAAGNAKSASRDLDTVEDELDRILGSQKFTRRVGGITGAVKDLAREIESDFIKELGRRASQEASRHAASSSSGEKKKKKRDKSIPKISFGDNNGFDYLSKSPKEITVAYFGLSLRINETHYEKLQILFDRFNTYSTSLSDHRDRFASALFSLLCRYDMLEGGGLQSSLTGDVFDILLNRFDCRTECFASPFNCRYERYCSAFPDTDAAFGSLGSFFDFDPTSKGGCFQANPPFISGFIEMMERRMDGHLESTSGRPLMFIVFIPAWKETTGWKALNDSPHLTKQLLLSQKTDPHFYCEGTQHRRRGRYRIATFDTSVFFLQNSKARDKWPVTEEIVEELTMAFRRNPDEDGSQKTNEGTTAVALGAKANDKARPKEKKKKERRKVAKTRKEEVKQKGMDGVPKGGQRKSEKSKKKKRKLVEDGERKQMEILSSIFGGTES